MIPCLVDIFRTPLCCCKTLKCLVIVHVLRVSLCYSCLTVAWMAEQEWQEGKIQHCPDSELQNPPTLGPRSPGKSPLTISGPASLPCNQDQGSELSYVRRDHLDYHADARGRLAQQLLTQVRPQTTCFKSSAWLTSFELHCVTTV